MAGMEKNIVTYTPINHNVSRISRSSLDDSVRESSLSETNSKKVTTFDRLPGFVLVGDSTAAAGNRYFTVTSITSSGTTATATFTNHALHIGSRFVIANANQREYNGAFYVSARPSANTIQYEMLLEPSVTTATGTILLYSQDVVFESNWAVTSNAIAMNKGMYLGNYAVGGSKSSDLNVQLDMALDKRNNRLARDVDVVFISTGINDVIADVSYDEIIANISSAINRCIKSGAIPVVLTMFPLGSSYASWSVARVNLSRKVNLWITSSVESMGGYVVDANFVCIDKDSDYGDWITDYSNDHIHPQKLATFKVAKEIKRVFWDYVISNDDRTKTSVAVNPTLSGTGGTESGTGASGDTADNFTITASGGGSQAGIGSKGISLSGNGESQRIAITGSASGDIIEFSGSNVMESLSAGDKVIFQIRTRLKSDVDLGGLRHAAFNAVAVINGNTVLLYSGTMFYNSFATQNFGETWDMLLETPVITVPEGMTSLLPTYQVRFNSAGGPIDLDLSEYNAYKIQ
jgi:hypothetical protein